MLKKDPDPSAEPHQADDRQRKVSENMIKTAIMVRAIVYFFLAAFFLNIAYLMALPSLEAFLPKDSVVARCIVFSAILLPPLAIAIWDARCQARKYFGPKT